MPIYRVTVWARFCRTGEAIVKADSPEAAQERVYAVPAENIGWFDDETVEYEVRRVEEVQG